MEDDSFNKDEKPNAGQLDLGFSAFIEGTGPASSNTSLANSDEPSLSANVENEPKIDLTKHLKALIARRSDSSQTEDFNNETQSELDLVRDLENSDHIVHEQLNKYELYARRESWNELIEHCEREFAQDGSNSLEARLWWVHAQSTLKDMPLAILAAPLDSVSETLLAEQEEYEPRLLELCKNLLHSIAIDLREQEQLEIAELFLERHEALSSNKNGHKTSPSQQKCESQNDSNSISEKEEWANRLRNLSENSLESITEEEQVEIIPENIVDSKRQPSYMSLVLLVLIVAALFSSGFVELPSISSLRTARLNLTRNPLVLTEYRANNEVSLKLPELKFLSTAGSHTLRGILDTLARPAEKLEVRLAKNQAKRVKIDTTQPGEPPEVRALFFPSNDSLIAQARAQTESLSKPIVRGETKEDPIVSARPIVSTRSAPQPVLPPSSVVYQLRVATAVFSAPDWRADEVAQLAIGDRIRVEEILGKWLKIVSKSNRIGYIPKEAAIQMDRDPRADFRRG